jgi:hypothetical protein
MADLNYKDWGRIYAYIWLQDRVGNPYYKHLIERDPVRAITEIIQALNKDYPDPTLQIKYTPNVDAVWDIEPPKDFYPGLKKAGELEQYRSGIKKATLRMRLAC